MEGFGETVGTHVRIKQKVIRHTPLDKLLDAFINILAGGEGLVETRQECESRPGIAACVWARKVRGAVDD